MIRKSKKDVKIVGLTKLRMQRIRITKNGSKNVSYVLEEMCNRTIYPESIKHAYKQKQPKTVL